MNSFTTSYTQQCLSELTEFLSIPSISADKNYLNDIERAADFLVDALTTAGLQKAAKYYAGGNAIVYAEKIVDEDMPTILIYGHYDVQPVDPIELWHTPPFEPTINDGKIYARGACDDKAQVHLIIKALELIHRNAAWPCNIKVMFEGEEETGSGSLMRFVSTHQELLSADVLLVCDTSMPSEDKPTLVTGLRGVAYFELEVNGAPHDLHSGMLGGAIINPLQVLCTLLSKLKNEQNEICIPGFYDGIHTSHPSFHMPKVSPSLQKHVSGEKGYTASELISVRPSLDINGLTGGYAGDGPKTIIPSKASAKLSMRLVEGQDHQQISDSLQNFLQSLTPKEASLHIKKLAGCNAVSTNTTSAAYQAAIDALEKNFSGEVLNTHIGGSIPIVSFIKDQLNVETVLMGFGLDSDQIHAPNESFSISNYFKGIQTVLHFFENYSSISMPKTYTNTIVKQSSSNS